MRSRRMPAGLSDGRSSSCCRSASHCWRLQGVSEIIKRIAALEHLIDIEFKYEKPLQ